MVEQYIESVDKYTMLQWVLLRKKVDIAIKTLRGHNFIGLQMSGLYIHLLFGPSSNLNFFYPGVGYTSSLINYNSNILYI